MKMCVQMSNLGYLIVNNMYFFPYFQPERYSCILYTIFHLAMCITRFRKVWLNVSYVYNPN